MQAFKCDRCGEYYSAEDENRVRSVFKTVIKRNGCVLDICPNCANSLLNWLLMQGENNENDGTTDV